MEKKTENEMETVIIWWFIGLRASKELQSKLLRGGNIGAKKSQQNSCYKLRGILGV